MNKKEQYEGQSNFCSEFMKCFVDLYIKGIKVTNKKLKRHVEMVNKMLNEENKRKNENKIPL